VIAATNASLPRMISEGTFREDLFYRLNVIAITLPPLRERREDIPLLVKHFVQKFAQVPDQPPQLSQGAMRCMMGYAWPGNVRQLENAVERAVMMSGGRREIEVGDLPDDIRDDEEAGSAGAPHADLPQNGLDLNGHMLTIEKDLIVQALARTNGNRNKAAEILRIKRTTLVEKMKRLGID
jgi:transcriptional regulator with PAS, ATPase and Fis domain